MDQVVETSHRKKATGNRPQKVLATVWLTRPAEHRGPDSQVVCVEQGI